MFNSTLIQEKTNRLITLCLAGSYLSNSSKIFYPLSMETHQVIAKEILDIRKYFSNALNGRLSNDLHSLLAEAIKTLTLSVEDLPQNSKNETIVLTENYDSKKYSHPRLKTIKKFRRFIVEKLEPYLTGAYIHGSLSTMDYTGYSDLDTLFIIKQEALEDPQKIKKLEKLFIRSTRFLYQFDPLQHHGHFFLLESDLRNYNQSFLPLSTIKLSTSLLNKGTRLELSIRNFDGASKQRFMNSLQIVRRYILNDSKKLVTPYYLKVLFSHFMLLPVLFLQLKGEYVSKKDSFEILERDIPLNIWQSIEQVSAIRREWNQRNSFLIRQIIHLLGMWNPLLIPFFSKSFIKKNPIRIEVVNSKLLDSMLSFSEYLYKMSGINEKELTNR